MERNHALYLAYKLVDKWVDEKVNPDTTDHTIYDNIKTAHNVDMRLKDFEKKFSGDLGECWQDWVDEYNQVAKGYKLDEE